LIRVYDGESLLDNNVFKAFFLIGTIPFKCLLEAVALRAYPENITILGKVSPREAVEMGLHGNINGLDDLRMMIHHFKPIYSLHSYLKSKPDPKRFNPLGDRTLLWLVPLLCNSSPEETLSL